MNPETPAADIQNVQPPAPPPAPDVVQVAQPPQPVEGQQAPSQPAAPAAPEPAQPVAGTDQSAPAAPAAPPTPEGPLPPSQGAPQVVAPPPSEPKVMDAAWPFVGYNGPQPWEADNPPMLTTNHLMLSAGMSGPEVVELAGLLAYLGYGTSISAGQNPHAIYDSGVSEAVRAFCRDYGVQEDPQVRQARTDDTVGPWLWEALVRAVHKKVAQDQDQQ